MKRIVRESFLLKLLATLVAAAALLSVVFPAGAVIDASLQMQLGNPSGATADPSNTNHYLIQRSVEAIDYSDHYGQPNWASWDLTSSDVGSSGRSDAWAVDTSLPSGFYPVPISTFGTYNGTSYDRGHMCPSADRTDTTADNEQVFIMSNIIPQASAQNQGVWANFENYSRSLLTTQELLITSGPSAFGPLVFDSSHVAVASNTWKIVVGVPLGSGTALSRITNANPNAIRVIALEIPNTAAAGGSPWTEFVTNVHQIEMDTGFTFFTALPPNLAWVLRSKVDGQSPAAPGVTGFSPASGAAGATVTLTGTNLGFTTNVTFNGTSASFTIVSTAQITATVPAGAASGHIGVATLGGTAASSGSFTVGTSATPDLAITATHTGNFTQGDAGDTYTITVTNLGTAASSGPVSVVDTLPTGLTAAAISGTGWTANPSTLTCTRSDALAAGTAYPAITLTVNVAANAPGSIANTATVSGGGETNTANDTASDPTTINAAAAPTATTGAATSVGTAAATLNGTVNPNGQPTAVHFDYGLTTGYGSTAAVASNLSGTTTQAVTASLTGLAAGTTYHFRVAGTNVLGIGNGLDQTFTTALPGVADLAVKVTHAGSFTQGDAGDTYTITVTNIGTAASTGTVSVVDTLPTGLTAAAISGTGWTLNLATRTGTRSDALAAGAVYPAITLTVNVSGSTAASVTNTATVSGGGETNTANDTATDPTTINAAAAPTITTGTATSVGTTTATLNGTVNPNGQTTRAQFDYGTTTSYGSVASVAGTLTGTSAQAVSAGLTGLTAGLTYHFRVSATNVLGSTSGVDRTFTTTPAGVPDLAVIVAHSGNFTQASTGTYTITVTNAGNAASSGTVTVADTLPAGLTATAITGTGWTTDLDTLVCTRSDALAAGASYLPITVTVNVAASAPASVTNTATVSGGGDTSIANNTANDPTAISPASTIGGPTTLVGWDVSLLPGGLNNFGPSPMAPTTNAANLTIVAGLTRGTGVGTNANPAAARAWGGNTFTDTDSASAIAANRFATFSLAANGGYKVSYTAISRFDYRHSGTGPATGLLQYQIGSAAFADITALSYPSNTTSGGSLNPINLSGIPALQNVGAGTNVTFRIVNWGGTSSAGTWYIFDVTNSTAPDFVVSGTVAPVVAAVADLAVSISHAGGFTQGDTGRTYTITVTNSGTAATAGTVSVTNLLPAGLTATAINGSGWTPVPGTRNSCTRSDALAAGAIYPPITLTVNVWTNAPNSVTNSVTVSNTADTNTANNLARDPTSIIALTPIQAWRLQWFGTTADSGLAADSAIRTSDGMANLLKYALGLDPLVATNDPVAGDISTGYLRLTVPRNPAATDVSFRVELTGDLTTPAWATNGTTVVQNTPTLLQVRDNAPVASSAGGFMRLRVSRP